MFIKQPNLGSGIQTECTVLANSDLSDGLQWKFSQQSGISLNIFFRRK